MTILRVGQTLYSAVDATTVLVVVAPKRDVSITCGGVEMSTARPNRTLARTGAGETWTQLGKRYTSAVVDIELLCTNAGAGTLAVNGTLLEIKAAKPLPASD